MESEHPQLLVELGFTEAEAEVYACLLGEGTITGYRVAQAIGKPVANTYKAIESLRRKGAVLVDEGETRQCRAVPPDELLQRLQREFASKCARAGESLSRIRSAPGDDRLYQLASKAQVLERCRAMLDRARHVVVADLSPEVAVELRDALGEAMRRGVETVIKTYRTVDVEATRLLVRPRGHEITDALPGELVSLNVDGSEHVLALLRRDGDGVFQAIWTSSPIVAYLLYNGLVNELSQVAIMRELEHEATSVDALRAAFQSLRHLHPATSRGHAYQNLMRRLGLDPSSKEPSAPGRGQPKPA